MPLAAEGLLQLTLVSVSSSLGLSGGHPVEVCAVLRTAGFWRWHSQSVHRPTEVIDRIKVYKYQYVHGILDNSTVACHLSLSMCRYTKIAES